MKRFISIVCLILVLSTCLVIPVAAQEVTPYASNYFMSYSTYLWKTSSTEFQIWFDVTAVGGMDKLGVSYIEVQQSSDNANWTSVATYDKDDYTQLVASGTGRHESYVTYSNYQSGYYYRAYVEFYAKKGTGTAYYGDYAYFAN